MAVLVPPLEKVCKRTLGLARVSRILDVLPLGK